MTVIYSGVPYPESREKKYEKYFNSFPFSLSSFQKYSIEAIVEGHHVLVTAHTGSGKTLPAEFAIEFFVKTHKKKVIYTSPIKALSNQKFYELSKKFPDISFGILTGDIKSNPDADVLIMTTEILQNSLYSNSSETKTSTPMSFQINFDNELACVVFDEVHYINDPDRGHVWEETIMLLPKHVQMVMLSATIDSPEKFAHWCEHRNPHGYEDDNTKQVYLVSTYKRVVPLTHYMFVISNSSAFKVIKDKEIQDEIKAVTNKLHVVSNADGVFNETNYFRVQKVLSLLDKKNVDVKRSHVMNSVLTFCAENEMLPALCFVFSRKMLEICAREITATVLEFDSKVPYIIRNECEQIVRKLPNYREFLELPEYLFMVSLLEKGVAIHHAGIMPILREMVELLYSKGYIKVLFATETFAVGINMPTKTVIFTDINKYDGKGQRPLYSHEYTQMAGRAGRRGIDTVGHVIHLNNLFRNITTTDYKLMLKGTPQTLVSKFKISYNLILNNIEEKNIYEFSNRSMISQVIDSQKGEVYENMCKIDKDIHGLYSLLPRDLSDLYYEVCKKYNDLEKDKLISVNKKRKEIDKKLATLKETYPSLNIDKYKDTVKKIMEKEKEHDSLEKNMLDISNSLNTNIDIVISMLCKQGFIEEKVIDSNTQVYKLTQKGKIAANIREVCCIPFTNWLLTPNLYDHLSAVELAQYFSYFTNITIKDELKAPIDPYNSLISLYQEAIAYEDYNGVSTGTDYSFQMDIAEPVKAWCKAITEEECKQVLESLKIDKEIFLGEFVKALLKINTIAQELETVAEQIGNIELLSKLREIPGLTLKYVATNQSLYV